MKLSRRIRFINIPNHIANIKRKNAGFFFGRFFTSKKIIAVHLPDDLPLATKSKRMQNTIRILEKVQRYIDTELNPYKNNFF